MFLPPQKKPRLWSPRATRPPRRGAIVVLVCLLLPMVFALLALFVGVSQMQFARGQMRVAADAASRAAVEAVLRTENAEQAFLQAQAIAARHVVMDQPILLERQHVTFGQSVSRNASTWTFVPDLRPFNAAQVKIEKSRQAASGVVSTLFPAFGIRFFETAQHATATQIDHDLVFVIEAGGSMHAPGRWEGVTGALAALARVAPQTANNIQVGLVVCKNNPSVEIELSDNSLSLQDQVQQLSDQAQALKLSQGRNLGDGIALASTLLTEAQAGGHLADQTIVFLGNGHSTKGIPVPSAASQAAAHGQVLYALTFGHNADKNGDLESAAQITGGEYRHVTDLTLLEPLLVDLLINPSIVLIR